MSPSRSNAILVPSGEYAGSAAPSLATVRRSPPVAESVIRAVPSVNAIRRPSGDQSGAAIPGVESNTRSDPSTSLRRTSSLPASPKIGPRTYATVFPSGETDGIWSHCGPTVRTERPPASIRAMCKSPCTANTSRVESGVPSRHLPCRQEAFRRAVGVRDVDAVALGVRDEGAAGGYCRIVNTGPVGCLGDLRRSCTVRRRGTDVPDRRRGALERIALLHEHDAAVRARKRGRPGGGQRECDQREEKDARHGRRLSKICCRLVWPRSTKRKECGENHAAASSRLIPRRVSS